jgi:oxalate decarboxylase/phosphoglucose isomerase-like protein (cupin superfamily)
MICKLFITILIVLVAVSQGASQECTASASLSRRTGHDWVVAEKNYTIYDMTIVNTGACSLNLIRLQFALPSGAQIAQAWNLNALGNGIWEVTNFGPTLAIGATFSGAGLNLEFTGQASLSVSVANTNCQCDQPIEPTDQPTGQPTMNPTMNPTIKPTMKPQTPASAETITKLITAPSQLERLMLLSDDQFVFDFKNSLLGVTQSAGGITVATSRSNFPAVIGHNIAMTVGYIEPCGINLPHTHPRATEINFIASGRFRAGFIMENGARFIGNVLEAGMATIFPQGAIHFEINLDCTPAVFVAAFNNEDPGVQTTANSFFGLPTDAAGISLNISSIQTVEDLAKYLPSNPAVAMEACMKKCGFSK